MLRLKANKTALYKLVADYVDNLPPMRSGTEFIKYSRTPDYALNWITPEWNTAHAGTEKPERRRAAPPIP